MESTPTIVTSPPRDLVLEATRAYNETIDSDGATPAVWDRVADDLIAAAVAHQLTGDRAYFVLSRARDARGNARYAERMIANARLVVSQRGCIDLASLSA